jgi:hypothetical protein
MRIVCNEQHIRVRRFVGKNAPLVGLVALAIGLILSLFHPDQLLIMAICMVLGVSFSIVGGIFSDRYAGPLAHHDALSNILKGLGSQYVLVQYILPVPHVLLEPGGLTALVVRSHGGWVAFQKEGRWKHRQPGKAFRQMVGQPGVGAPDLEAEYQAKKLKNWLAERLPDTEVPVRAVIVFVNPHVRLDATDSLVPAFYGKKVKAWLRGPGKQTPMPSDVYRQLAKALGLDEGL